MTISSLLSLRGPTSTTTSPSAGLGHGHGLGHRAPSLHGAHGAHGAQHRGDIWIQSEGWKGGKKGDSAALSALTLLAFLFFLHILQSCLQDINNTQPTYVMATGGARREEVPTMVAVPVATPMPAPAAGMPAMGMPAMVAVAPARARRAPRHVHSEELARHLQRVQQQQREPGWEMVSVVGTSSKRPPGLRVQPAGATTMVAVGLTPGLSPRPRTTAAPREAEAVAEVAAAAEERVVSITPRPSSSAEAGTAMVRVSSSSTEAEEDASTSDEIEPAAPAANKQEEYELLAAPSTTERIETATVPAAAAVAVPVAMLPLRPAGHVVTFVPLARPLASTVRGVLSLLAAPLLRLVQPMVQAPASASASASAPAKIVQPAGAGGGLGAALSAGLGQGLREGLRSAICCDLVVCEAHRIGSIGGRIGERVASTVSSMVRWVCGEAEEGELKAAALRGQGRAGSAGSAADERGGCRYHIEQCERRAGRRTAVTTIASLLEAYVTGGTS